ncbi:hypothetical protein GCM10027169_24530 [Gordonia jinhuaensis]|uniref:Uncharacterized protein n=1 Tax=Gordonia jinhuaensis TaxID=1517702 RepID=A0A916TCG4_9ACTN|nr:hypothetical protein [Gordonia jinhuaensis]GGB39912.1 hypothetical protein GCM10011489_29410 [Gordonia jinhuaensis]
MSTVDARRRTSRNQTLVAVFSLTVVGGVIALFFWSITSPQKVATKKCRAETMYLLTAAVNQHGHIVHMSTATLSTAPPPEDSLLDYRPGTDKHFIVTGTAALSPEPDTTLPFTCDAVVTPQNRVDAKVSMDPESLLKKSLP